jgi:hypothetical protein
LRTCRGTTVVVVDDGVGGAAPFEVSMSSHRPRDLAPARFAWRLRQLFKLSLPCAIVVAVWYAAAVATREGVYVPTLQDHAREGDLAGVERALGRLGGDVNAVEPGSGRTALIAAAGRGQVGVARLLLSRGADV